MCILQLKVKEICSLLLLHLTRFLSSTDQLLLVPSELSEGRKERERDANGLQARKNVKSGRERKTSTYA